MFSFFASKKKKSTIDFMIGVLFARNCRTFQIFSGPFYLGGFSRFPQKRERKLGDPFFSWDKFNPLFFWFFLFKVNT